MRGIVKKLVGAAVWRIVWEFIKDHPLWTTLGAAVSGLASYLLGLDWEVWFFGSTIIFCLFMLIRQTWFPHGFRKKKPQPAQPPVQEESAPQPEPTPELLPVDLKILPVISLLLQGQRPFTNHNVRDYLLDERPSFIDDRLIFLKETKYIVATVTPTPTLGIPEFKKIEIHGLTAKGRKTI